MQMEMTQTFTVFVFFKMSNIYLQKHYVIDFVLLLEGMKLNLRNVQQFPQVHMVGASVIRSWIGHVALGSEAHFVHID